MGAILVEIEEEEEEDADEATEGNGGDPNEEAVPNAGMVSREAG